jgi:hypothetical protein
LVVVTLHSDFKELGYSSWSWRKAKEAEAKAETARDQAAREIYVGCALCNSTAGNGSRLET